MEKAESILSTNIEQMVKKNLCIVISHKQNSWKKIDMEN